MKSQHPEYLESFVKTCMAHGLDEEATAMLLDKARHNDSMSNSPEYRDGFHSELLAIKNNGFSVKNAQLGALLKKIPTFLKGVATVPAMYGAYAGGKGLYEGARNKINEALTDYTTNRMISRGELPSLSGFEGATSGGNKGRFADALYAMQAADAGMTAGDVRPLMSSRQDASKLPILQGLRKKLYDVQTAIDAPITDPSGYANVAGLMQRQKDLEKQYAQALRYSASVSPTLKKQTDALEKLHKKYITSGLSGDEQKNFEALSSRVPNLSRFQQQLGQ